MKIVCGEAIKTLAKASARVKRFNIKETSEEVIITLPSPFSMFSTAKKSEILLELVVELALHDYPKRLNIRYYAWWEFYKRSCNIVIIG